MEEQSAVLSVLFLDSIYFSIPGLSMGSNTRPENKGIDCFVFVCSCWVFISTKIFVMSLNVLIKEMGVHELSIRPGTGKFVNELSFVE
jgi:hypothetical protein